MLNKKIVVVADDFTGSNDTGVQFSKRGFKTFVVTNLHLVDETLTKCEALVIDTESRFNKHKDAYDTNYNVGKVLKEQGIDVIYKKIDSTFRGNIGAEINGLLDGTERKVAIMAAALPSNGRIIREGKVYVHGELLEETEFAKDPKTPVDKSYIPHILDKQSSRKVGVILHKDIVLGQEHLEKSINEMKETGVEIIVLDGESNEDLALEAKVIAKLHKEIIIVGSAGLAEQLPQALELNENRKNVAVIAGSISDRTREQVTYASEELGVDVIDINVEAVLGNKSEEEKKRIIDLIKEKANKKEHILVRSAKTREEVKKAVDFGKEIGLSSFQVSDNLAAFLGEISKFILEDVDIDGVMLTGGDIAIKTTKLLNTSGMIIENEIVPGVPYGYFLKEEISKVPIITKAGGFGEKDAIVKVIQFILGR